MRPLKTVLAERDETRKALEANLALSKKEGRSLTEDEKKTHDELMAKMVELREEAEEIQRLDAEMAKHAQLTRHDEDEGDGTTPAVSVIQNRPKGQVAVRMLQSLVAFKSTGTSPVAYAENVLRDSEVAKALAAGSASSGGVLVPEQYSAEIIEFLRPMTTVRALGARTIPIPFGTLNMPRIASGSTAGYVGENDNIGITQPSVGNVKFTAKKLAAIVPISNELLRNPSPDVEGIVRDDLVRSISVTEDAAFLRNEGVGGAPKGLYFQAASANLIPANASVSIANIDIDAGKAETALAAANIPMIQPGWIFAPRVAQYLKSLRTTDGAKAFPEMGEGMFRGYPYRQTSNIPTNLGGGTESEVYFADFAQVMIGDKMGIELQVSTEAAYTENGTVKSAFQRDQTLVRAIMEHDLQVRHPSAIAVLTAVTWGA